MKFIKQKISEVVLIKPTIHVDSRGYFTETFRKDLLEEVIGYQVNFIQDNESRSAKGVLRGLHYQLQPYTQAKLVRVIEGSVLDVAVDIRRNSPTFGHHISVELSSENKHQLFVPHGFAHGFVVISDNATFTYKVDNFYSPEHERGIAYDDAKLGIDWQLPTKEVIISGKDAINPNLSNAIDVFE